MNFRHTEALDYIKKIAGDKYDVGIILGTGLGGLVKEIKINPKNSEEIKIDIQILKKYYEDCIIFQKIQNQN